MSTLDKFIINGNKTLHGEVTVSGAKNAVVAIIPATIMVNGVCRIENVPRVSDVIIQLEILQQMGARVRSLNPTTVEIDCRGMRNARTPEDLMRKLRASYYLIGTLLGRYHKAEVAMPGGCNFGGVRPIDQHVKGFEALGATVSIKNGYVYAEAPQGLRGANVYLDVVSVGATMNVMLAATMAQGQTVIENAAKEPHIVDLANFLNAMGADIMGAGTDVIKVRGVQHLHGCEYSIIPDQIEAGTFMIIAAATDGDILVRGVIPKHLEAVTAKLQKIGAKVVEYDDAIRVTGTGVLKKTSVKTMPHPGFPTDLQPQITTLLTLAQGTSIVTEDIFDNRFKYVDELRRMGADISVDGKVAVVEGTGKLKGAPVKANDLRAGAAMIIAGLAADGITEIENIHYIERGYEGIERKLKALGADIKKIVVPDCYIQKQA